MKTLEDLQFNGLKIYVDKSGFTYGRDAVLLANFAKPSAKEHILDLGTGTGILAILISGKTGARVTAVELQKDAASLAEESVLLKNGRGIAEAQGLSCIVVKSCVVLVYPVTEEAD